MAQILPTYSIDELINMIAELDTKDLNGLAELINEEKKLYTLNDLEFIVGILYIKFFVGD